MAPVLKYTPNIVVKRPSGECPRILISQSHSRGSPLRLEWPTHGPASKCQVPCWWKPLHLPVQRKLTCLLSRSTFSKDVQEKYLSLKSFNLRQQLKFIFYTFTALGLLCEHNYLSSPKRWPVQFFTLTITHYFYDCLLPATNAAVLMSPSSHVRSLLTSYLLLFLEWKRQKHLPAWLYYILILSDYWFYLCSLGHSVRPSLGPENILLTVI